MVERRRSFLALSLLISAGALPASAASLSGRVVEDHTGRPLASAEVKLRRPGAAILTADLETDTEGRFAADGIEPGEYRLEVAKPGLLPVTMKIALAEAQPAGAVLAVRLVRSAAITGQVRDGTGQPVAGAWVHAMVRVGNMLRPWEARRGTAANTDARGGYRLFDLPPGEYAVAVSYGASKITVASSARAAPASPLGSGVMLYPDPARPRWFAVRGGEEYRGIDFVVTSGPLFAVSGAVEIPEGGRKGGYWVSLTSPAQPALTLAAAPPSEDGQFRLTGIPPGSYVLAAAGPSNAYSGRGGIVGTDAWFGRMLIEVSGRDLDGLSIPMQKGAGATLVPRLGQQGGCSGALTFNLASAEDWAVYLGRSVAASVGKPVLVAGLAPAPYVILPGRVGEGCYVMASVPVMPGAAAPVEVPVVTAGAVRVRVTGPLGTATVVLTPLAAAEGATPVAGRADASGIVMFPDVVPGRYAVAARPDGARWVGAPGAVEVVVAGGGAVTEVSWNAPGETQ